MTHRTETDFKANLADLTKIPPNEFEKHFHDWMQRDDVARGLQAKLRCDLIKNFNKTNLGKHIISHTMTSSGGSSTRLTLSPLILALNTLVAEFLYAQNCHFTLSVFCTEIPFRNTLPDFESQRNFRFNKAEIIEIWEAVTGAVANKKDFNKHIIQNYETNPNLSLLLLIVKYLLEQKPVELLRKSVEIQTENQHTTHRSTSVQASEIEHKSPTKDESLEPINKHLSTLSKKVTEMIHEFEQFSKQRNLPRPIRSVRSSRSSRDYMALNKSLERITDNMKHISLAKRKSKHFTNIVESIDKLTNEFGKCAQHFDNVTKVFTTSENKSPVKKPQSKKLNYKEKETETEVQEKSYADWIQEMRTTTNGTKFLDRVEISLRKALKKHREQLQNETDIKIKHLKSVMKLHYQQKLTKHLMQHDSKASSEANSKLNKRVEIKLKQFEMKQMELMKQLQESSYELREAQRKQEERRETQQEEGEWKRKQREHRQNEQEDEEELREAQRKQRELRKSERDEEFKRNQREHRQTEPEVEFKRNQREHRQTEQEELREVQRNQREQRKFQQEEEEKLSAASSQGRTETEQKQQAEGNTNRPIVYLRDASSTQKEIKDMVQTIAEQGHAVDHIIYDAKLRMQQLESESNQLEENFQAYLKRRKLEQQLEQKSLKEHLEKLSIKPKESLTTKPTSNLDFNKPKLGKSILQNLQSSRTLAEEDDEDNEEEFQHLIAKMHESEKPIEQPLSTRSTGTTSSLELKNAILEAKLKFFEHESTLRKSKEQELEIHSGSLLQKHLAKYHETFEPYYYNQNFGQKDSEDFINIQIDLENKDKIEFNIESSLSEINIKDKTLDEEQEIDVSPMTEKNLEKLTDTQNTSSVKRQLFPRDLATNGSRDRSVYTLKSDSEIAITERVRYHEPIALDSMDMRQALKGLRNYAENMDNKDGQQTEITSQLLKQSMAKMQQLFEEKPKEAKREIERPQEMAHTESKLENPSTSTLTSSTTIATHTTTTTATSSSLTKEERLLKTQTEMLKTVEYLNRISNTSIPSTLDLSSGSDASLKPKNETKETAKFLENPKDKEQIVEKEDHFNESDDSYQSSEYKLLPNTGKNNDQKEMAEDNTSSDLSQLNVVVPAGNETEIGEILSESLQKFTNIEVELSDSSARSSSVLEISTGQQSKHHKAKQSDDSESDFWA